MKDSQVAWDRNALSPKVAKAARVKGQKRALRRRATGAFLARQGHQHHARSAAASAARTARAQVPTSTRVRSRATRLAVHFRILAASFTVWCTTGTSWCWRTTSGSRVSGYDTGVGTMGFGRRIVSLTGARRALLFDRSHVWKSSSSARGAGCSRAHTHTELGIFPPHALVRLARVGPDGEGRPRPRERGAEHEDAGRRAEEQGMCGRGRGEEAHHGLGGSTRVPRYGVLPLRQGPAGWGSARAPPPRFSGEPQAGRAQEASARASIPNAAVNRRQWQPEKPEFAESMVRWFKHRRNSSALVVTGGAVRRLAGDLPRLLVGTAT